MKTELTEFERQALSDQTLQTIDGLLNEQPSDLHRAAAAHMVVIFACKRMKDLMGEDFLQEWLATVEPNLNVIERMLAGAPSAALN